MKYKFVCDSWEKASKKVEKCVDIQIPHQTTTIIGENIDTTSILHEIYSLKKEFSLITTFLDENNSSYLNSKFIKSEIYHEKNERN